MCAQTLGAPDSAPNPQAHPRGVYIGENSVRVWRGHRNGFGLGIARVHPWQAPSELSIRSCEVR
jgi:hypothetical protein